jgi:hypothetical protein
VVPLQGGTEQGVSAITPQGVSMGLQLEQLRLQNELAKAEIGKTAAEGEKIKEETKNSHPHGYLSREVTRYGLIWTSTDIH